MKKRFIALTLFVFCFLITPGLFAGITGKIRGVVKDANSGEPLPGANVVISKIWIEGSERDYDLGLGAATNIAGEYIMLKVPPGVYTLTASMMGYTAENRIRVRVSVDRTTEVDFTLSETVLETGAEIVVEAKRDLVQLDVAATESYVSAEEYEATPFANRIEDVLGLQSGVTGNIIEGEIKIREGAALEVGFLLDGMDMVDQKFNRPVMAIQPGTVEEIKVMRNGFNAEYGQSRSGVINVITKNPADRLHFSLDYQFDPANKPHYGRDKYDPNWNWWRLYAGPDSFEPDTLYWVDGLYTRYRAWKGWNAYAEELLSDNNPDNDLTAEEAAELWKWRHRPVKYGDKHGHNIDLSLSGRVPLIPWRANFLLGGKYEYHPFSFPQSRDHFDERLTSLKVVNQVGENIKLTVNSLYSEVRTVTQGSSTSSWSHEDRISYSGGGFPGYYLFSKPILDRYTTIAGAKLVHTISPKTYYEVNANHFHVKYWQSRPPLADPAKGRYFHGRLYYDPQSGWIPKELGADDEVSGYQMYGGALTWDNSYTRRTTLSSSLTSQFHPAHELKAGFEFNYNTLREDRVHWHDEDSTKAFIRDYLVNPIEAGVYVQDKIEFQGMIANIGLRFDYFDVNGERPNPHVSLSYPTDRALFEDYVAGTYPTFRPKAKTYFSPRIGISHPLSDRSKIYFNYGHFVQTPVSEVLFHTSQDWSRPRIVFMGNPDIDFPKTIAYELGFDMSINDFFQLHVGGFYKDYFDYESGMVYAHSDQSMVMEWYDQNNYMEIRGVEIELRKNVGRFITGWFNYNYIKKSEANLEIPNLSQIPIITDDPSIGRNGVLWGVPRSNIILIEPYARGVITFKAPPEWGPRIGNYPVLHKTNLSVQLFYQAGPQRRHPSSNFRNLHPDVWFRELDRYWANIRLNREFKFKSIAAELYMDISNVWHTKFRYPPGGQSGEDYYYDLWQAGRLDQVGTDKLTNPDILRTESDDVYWAKLKTVIFGLRLHL